MHEDFKKWLTSDKILFNELYNLSISENFEILNFYNNKLFTNEDFFDFDHLNSIGANKLTDLIHKYILDNV